MRCRAATALVIGAACAALVWPAASVADHVSVSPSVGASLEKLSPSAGKVEVRFAIACHGVGSGGAQYSGSLALIDLDTGEETFLGGTSIASGTTEVLISRGDSDRRVRPRLRATCADYATLHGSPSVEVYGESVLIPRRGDAGGGGGGGGGGGHGGGGGGSGGGDPDDPLRPGGCANELFGTPAADRLDGGPGGDLILAFGGADRVRGRDGHDCLIGSSGRDRLLGEDGFDRLSGGRGGDRLDGGPGANAYDAGPGNDRVNARNGRRETVRCGPGDDRARVDRSDRARGCEHVAGP